LLVDFTFLPLMIQGYREGQPSIFYFYLPFHVVQKVAYAGAYLAKSKRSNIAWLTLLNLLLLFNYWDNGAIPQFIDRAYGAL
jgi:hypothetical protein